MARNNLEKAIQEAASKFAMEIVAAVKASSLQELIALQEGTVPKRRGRKPGIKAAAAPKVGRKPGRKPGRPKKVVENKVAEKPEKKKRVVRNYPKCAYPSCTKNRFVRGKGFCGDHYKMFQAGEIKAAEEYKK